MKSAFSKLLSMFGISREAAAEIRSAPKAAPQPTTTDRQPIKTDRDHLYMVLRYAYGVSNERLDALKSDLEPLFQMADSTGSSFSLAEGTNPGYELQDRQRPGGTLTLKLDDLTIIEEEAIEDGELIASYRGIAERYQPLVEPFIDEAQLCTLGSLIGGTLLDALYSVTPSTKKIVDGKAVWDEEGEVFVMEYAIQWYYVQVLALYRVAVAVAGLETEGLFLGNQIKLYMRYAAEQIQRWHDDSYDGMTYESTDSCEETVAAS